MSNLFVWAENIIRDFSIWDIAVFKLYLFSVGLIVGAYFSMWVKSKIRLVVAVAVLTGAWLVYKMFS